MMMGKETLSVTAVVGATITGKVLLNTPIQPARIKRIPFDHPGWEVAALKLGERVND